MPCRGGGKMGACLGATASRPLQAPRALLPQSPTRSYCINRQKCPHAANPLQHPPCPCRLPHFVLGRAVVSALHPHPLLQRSACPCSAVLRVRFLPTSLPRRVSQPPTSCISSPAIPALAGQGCAPVLMAVGCTTGRDSLPAVESPSYLAPTFRRPLPAAAYGLARLALFGALRLRVPDPP